MTRSSAARSYYLLAGALLLAVIPLPQAIGLWQPPWLAVALIWMVVAVPDDHSLVVAAVAGLVQDLLSGAPLGLHALAATVLTFIAVNVRHWMISSPPWQRFLLALGSLAAYLAIVALIGGWFGQPGSIAGVGSSLLSGGLLILIAFLFLRS